MWKCRLFCIQQILYVFIFVGATLHCARRNSQWSQRTCQIISLVPMLKWGRRLETVKTPPLPQPVLCWPSCVCPRPSLDYDWLMSWRRKTSMRQWDWWRCLRIRLTQLMTCTTGKENVNHASLDDNASSWQILGAIWKSISSKYLYFYMFSTQHVFIDTKFLKFFSGHTMSQIRFSASSGK